MVILCTIFVSRYSQKNFFKLLHISHSEPVLSRVTFISSQFIFVGLTIVSSVNFYQKQEVNPDLPYQRVVQWLSRGKILLIFFKKLRAESGNFLNKNHPETLLLNIEQFWKLAFAAELITFVNKFYRKLQMRG